MTRALLILSCAFVLAGTATTNILLHRIDLANAEAARAYAHTAILEARLTAITHRDVKPANDPRVDVCLKRTDALRSAIFALVRTGNASMVGNPGGEWITWR